MKPSKRNLSVEQKILSQQKIKNIIPKFLKDQANFARSVT